MKKYIYLLISEVRLKNKYSNLKLSGNFKIENTSFGDYNYIENATVLNSKLGDFSYIASQSIVNNCQIGKFCCIGPNVKIGLGNHPTKDYVSLHPVFYSTLEQVGVTFSDKNYFKEYEDTFIGNDVWIGANVVVKSGVKIGNGVVIGAGAIVTKNVEAYSVLVGVPAKEIRKRFSDEEIAKLERSKWWDKDIKWMKENYLDMQNIKNIKF